MRELSKEALEAREYCKNVGKKDGYQDCWVVNFKSHPAEFRNSRIGESIRLDYGYGVRRFYPYTNTYRIEADEDENGSPTPYNSYLEALRNLGVKI